MLASLPDLLLVVLGFGLIVFLHELGHFLAARWAGIRVLAFAVGFGPAMVSFRKGMGLQRGSSEAEYFARRERDPINGVAGLSPTEYRLNYLPFGGYVKMLGQEDLNPEAVSGESDSFQNCAPWKRLIVISAGVVMNIITAAVLFVVVFMAGMKVDPARVGSVAANSPAAMTAAINARELGISTPGLMPGDRIMLIGEEAPRSFADLVLATAMAEKGSRIQLTVRRSGYEQPLVFLLQPRVGVASGLLELGVEPSRSGEIFQTKSEAAAEDLAKFAASVGLPGLKPGMRLVAVDGGPASDANDMFFAVRESGGKPVELTFEGAGGERLTRGIVPRTQLQSDHLPMSDQRVAPVEHLLGLMPVMTVVSAEEAAAEQGLRDGDLFARIGNTEFPSVAQGVAEIRAHKGRSIPIVVLRKDAETREWKEVSLPAVRVSPKGQIGFNVGDTAAESALVAMPAAALRHAGEESEFTPSAYGAITAPGTRILSVNGQPVTNFASIRSALIGATRDAYEKLAKGATVTLRVRAPVHGVPAESAPVETIEWTISGADLKGLHSLGWVSPPIAGLFEPEQIMLKASSPGEALEMGLAETRRVMLTTYVTFLRLWQGSVKIEHLKGPVGIAHLGTLVAGRGFIWLLFFLALISVNLAVINFLPLPIVDGGQFLFILFEAVRGRPVPIAVQSAATIAGLVLIGCVFLIVTYNDIRNLLGL